MIRTLLTLGLAAGAAAWSAGQRPDPLPTAAEQLHMLQSNRGLLERLLNHSVEISDAENTLNRAEACRSAARTMAGELRATTSDTPPGRVEELAELLGTVWADGLAPALADARREVRAGSPEYARLQQLERQAVADIAEVTPGLQNRASAGPGVRAALTKLEQAGAQLAGGE